MKNRNSNFTTIGGLIFLLVLIIYTNTMGYRNVSGFLIFFLIIAMCSYTWGKSSCKKITLSITRDDLRAFPGEIIPVQLTLSNQKILPVTWMDILFPLPSPPCVWPSEGNEADFYEDPDTAGLIPVYRRKLTWILPFQKIEWSFTLSACTRGICRIDTVCLESGDGFGLTAVSRKISLAFPKQIVIYPKRLPVDITPLLRQNTSEAQGNYGYQEDLTLLRHSRAYQHGDSVRRINWRLLARQQELMVNEYETISPQCMGFYIDLESFVTFRVEQNANGNEIRIPSLLTEELEQMLSLVGSCICELTDRRIPCALIIPGYGDQDVQISFGNDLDYQVPQLLEKLSAIAYREAHWETQISTADLRPCRFRIGQLYITGSSASRLHTDAVLEAFSPHLLSYLVYEPGTDDLRMERPVLAFSELTFSPEEHTES